MAVIAISPQIGSRGMELGRLTAELLGYRFLAGEGVLAAGALRYHVTPEQLRISDERQPYFWERLRTDSERVFLYFRALVLEALAADRVVMVHRSAAPLVPMNSSGLRVRVTAPAAERIRQVMVEEDLQQAAAHGRVQHYDREVRARVQHLLGVDLEDPTLFNLVVNTSAMTLDALAAVLATCADRLERERGAAGLAVLRDASIAALVRAALASHPKIGHAQIGVHCDHGAVRLSGRGLVAPWDRLLDDVVRQIDGVKAVEIEAEAPAIPPRT